MSGRELVARLERDLRRVEASPHLLVGEWSGAAHAHALAARYVHPPIVVVDEVLVLVGRA